MRMASGATADFLVPRPTGEIVAGDLVMAAAVSGVLPRAHVSLVANRQPQ